LDKTVAHSGRRSLKLLSSDFVDGSTMVKFRKSPKAIKLSAWCKADNVEGERFWERVGCADARGPLHSWYEETLKAKWRRPQEIKDQYASASTCGNNRVVFNVGGNKYRLVVEVQYQAGIVWVKFIGTNVQYDCIDVERVNDYSSTTTLCPATRWRPSSSASSRKDRRLAIWRLSSVRAGGCPRC
jgi:mRNA interferase HigB